MFIAHLASRVCVHSASSLANNPRQLSIVPRENFLQRSYGRTWVHPSARGGSSGAARVAGNAAAAKVSPVAHEAETSRSRQQARVEARVAASSAHHGREGRLDVGSLVLVARGVQRVAAENVLASLQSKNDLKIPINHYRRRTRGSDLTSPKIRNTHLSSFAGCGELHEWCRRLHDAQPHRSHERFRSFTQLSQRNRQQSLEDLLAPVDWEHGRQPLASDDGGKKRLQAQWLTVADTKRRSSAT